jgi:hypothetical protein
MSGLTALGLKQKLQVLRLFFGDLKPAAGPESGKKLNSDINLPDKREEVGQTA